MNRIVIISVLAWMFFGGRLPAAETNAVQTLTLAEAWQLALHNHPRVAAARYQAGAAEEAVKEARSAELPAANLYGTAAGANTANDRIMAGGLNNPSVYDRLAGGLSVSQLITDFGRTVNLKAGAQFEAQAENENAAEVREQVWLQAATSYYGVLEAQAVLKVAQETVESRKLLLAQVSALATNKLKSELDVSFAQVALEEGQLLLERAQNGTDAAKATLADALGLREPRQFQLVEQPAPPLPATNDVEELIQTALGQRPELLSLRAGSDAARRFAWSERDARRPVISAEGMIGNSPTHDDRLADNYAAADLNVTLPLFSGGLYLARQHRAELKAQAAEELLRTAEDDVIREVRLAWLRVNNTLQLVQTTEELVRHATESFELAGARYQAGLSSMVELTDAQLSLISAQIARANAHYDLLVQQANLDYQTGRLH
jgi:outer membrane protein